MLSSLEQIRSLINPQGALAEEKAHKLKEILWYINSLTKQFSDGDEVKILKQKFSISACPV